MVMRPGTPGTENRFPSGRRWGLLISSVSICSRLEIIAILSGFGSPPGTVAGDQS